MGLHRFYAVGLQVHRRRVQPTRKAQMPQRRRIELGHRRHALQGVPAQTHQQGAAQNPLVVHQLATRPQPAQQELTARRAMQVQGKVVAVGAQTTQRAQQGLPGIERQQAGNAGMGAQQVTVFGLDEHIDLSLWAGSAQQVQQRRHQQDVAQRAQADQQDATQCVERDGAVMRGGD